MVILFWRQRSPNHCKSQTQEILTSFSWVSTDTLTVVQENHNVFWAYRTQLGTYSTAARTYPDLDAGASGSTEPVAIRAEAQGVDDVPTIKCIKELAFVEVPQHGLAILGKRKGESGQCDLFQMSIPAA